jgi:hypothetical protein
MEGSTQAMGLKWYMRVSNYNGDFSIEGISAADAERLRGLPPATNLDVVGTVGSVILQPQPEYKQISVRLKGLTIKRIGP